MDVGKVLIDVLGEQCPWLMAVQVGWFEVGWGF